MTHPKPAPPYVCDALLTCPRHPHANFYVSRVFAHCEVDGCEYYATLEQLVHGPVFMAAELPM